MPPTAPTVPPMPITAADRAAREEVGGQSVEIGGEGLVRGGGDADHQHRDPQVCHNIGRRRSASPRSAQTSIVILRA